MGIKISDLPRSELKDLDSLLYELMNEYGRDFTLSQLYDLTTEEMSKLEDDDNEDEAN